MGYAPADVVRGHERLLDARLIARAVVAQRPALEEQVVVDEAQPIVRIWLPDPARSVICAWLTEGRRSAFAIVAPDSDSPVWPNPDADHRRLAALTVGEYERCVAGP